MDGTLESLSTAITTEIADRIAAITAEEQRVDALIASGMWLFADPGRLSPLLPTTTVAWCTAMPMERFSMLTAECGIRLPKRLTCRPRSPQLPTKLLPALQLTMLLSGRLDVLEADPTTASQQLTAGDAATLSSGYAYTDAEIATEAKRPHFC